MQAKIFEGSPYILSASNRTNANTLPKTAAVAALLVNYGLEDNF